GIALSHEDDLLETGGGVAAPISKKVMDAYLLGPQYDELDEGQEPDEPVEMSSE
ncbi:MAG: hypothetical protein HQL47_07020, partial [Gammaproteobacteria bacterium]|nr:hypothetical protein [Gammaproteobacteria bacterium]